MPLARIGSIGRPAGYDPVAEIEKTAQRKAEKSEGEQAIVGRFSACRSLFIGEASLDPVWSSP